MPEETFSPHLEKLWTVCAEPFGKWIAFAGEHPGNQSVHITICSPKGVYLGKLRGHKSAVTSLAVDKKGRVVSAAQDGTISLWEIPPDLTKKASKKPWTGKPLQTLSVNATLNAIDILKDQEGGLVVVGTIESTPETPASGILYCFKEENGVYQENVFQTIESRAPLHSVTSAVLKDVEGVGQSWIATGGENGLLLTYLRQQDNNFSLWRDLTAPTAADASEGETLWSGHTGTVKALCFHPNTERLLSSGEDKSIRFWYLRGKVSYEECTGESNTTESVQAMLFGPEARDKKGEPIPGRLVSASVDGSIKLWPIPSKRAPKTLVLSRPQLHALTSYRLGAEHCLAAVGDDRNVYIYKFQETGSIDGEAERIIRSEFDRVERELSSSDPERRIVALQSFAKEGDPAILSMATRHLANDKSPNVRILAAKILGESGDQKRRKELRRALKDREAQVRLTALSSLRQLEGEDSLQALEVALGVSYEDIRREAISLLPSIAKKLPDQRPKVQELLQKSLVDQDAETRRRALDAIILLEGDENLSKALCQGIDFGKTDIKLESLRRIYRQNLSSDTYLFPTLMRGLESEDADVRRLSFYVFVSRQENLKSALIQADDRAKRAFSELKQGTEEEKEQTTKKRVELKQGDRVRVSKGERIDLEGIIASIDGETVSLQVAGQTWEVLQKNLELVASASALESPPTEELVRELRASLEAKEYSPIISALAARNVNSALRAARTLARLKDIRALGTLLQLTREKEAKARFDVVLALRDLGDTRAKERLASMLDDADREVRLLALDALDKLPGATPHDVAKTGLLSKHADIHLHALQRLLPPPSVPLDSQARKILLQGLGAESSERVRTEAFLILWAAACRPETEAAGTSRRMVVEKAMASPHPEIRRLGVRSAAENAVEGWASAVLGRAVDDEDAVVQREAWKCLIAEAKEQSRVAPLQAAVASRFAAILAWFNDSEKDKRNLAYNALWFSYPETPEEPLRLAARSRFSEMRLRALDAAKQYADETWAWELLRQGLDDNDEDVRGRSYRLLREHRGKKDPAPATVALSSRHPDIRSLAALHLGEVGERAQEAEPLLLRALRDETKLVRQNAYEALKVLAKQKHLDIDPILLGLESFYPELRRYALQDIEELSKEQREERRSDLRRLLGDESADVRQLAYQILRRHAGQDDPEPLRLALTSPHRDLREPALKALKDLDKGRLSKVQDVLTTHLHDENPSLRSQAYEAIVRAYGKGVLAPIKLALASPWPELREFAARDLAQTEASPDTETLLTQAMGDSIEEVRRVAFRSALTIAIGNPPQAEETIEEEAKRLSALLPEKRSTLSRILGAALRSPYWDLKLLAARQLALLRDDRSLIPMAELLLDPVEGKKPERRAQAVEILSRLEDPRAGLILQQLLDDPSQDVRLKVVDGLAASTRSGKVEALRDALARALKDKDEKVRTHAYQALAKESAIPRDFLIPMALSSSFVDLRRRAAEDVGTLKGEEALALKQPLSERLGDDDAVVRLKALASLREIAGEEDQDVLLGALASAYWDVKLEAAFALAEKGDRRALGPLVDILSDPEASKNKEGCLKALSALGKLGDRRASLIVQRLLRRSERDLQIAAVRALEACCREGEVEPLLEALRLPDETVQIAAAESLARFGDPRGMQVFAKTLEKGNVEVRRQVLKSYVALGLLGLRPIIDLTSDPDVSIRRDALSVIVAYLYGVLTQKGSLGSLSEEELHNVKTRFATAEIGELRFAAARLFEVESSPVAFYDFAIRQLLPLPAEKDFLSALEEPEIPEEEAEVKSEVELSEEEQKKQEEVRRKKRYQKIVREADTLLRQINHSDPQVRAAASLGVARLAMEGGLDTFLALLQKSRSTIRKWLMSNLETYFEETSGKEGFEFLLSIVDDVESIEQKQHRLEKSLHLSRALDDLEKRRIEERAKREFEEVAEKRHTLLALFFERLENIFTDYATLAEGGEDPLEDLLAKLAYSDWEEVTQGAREPSSDGGRRLYLSILNTLSFRDPAVEKIEREKELSLQEKLQKEYNARRPETTKELKAKRAKEEQETLAKGGRFLFLLLAMLFRLREEREKARDRERAAYLLAALTHSEPKVRQHAIEPLSQRNKREAFRKSADTFVKRIQPKTEEEESGVLAEISPLGWPELQGTLIETQVFQTLSQERYVTLWENEKEKTIESVRFDKKLTIVRTRHQKTPPPRLAEIAPVTRPSESKSKINASSMWQELAFGTYVGLLRPLDTPEIDKVREASTHRISAMALSGQLPKELAVPPLRHALADPVSGVRRAALESLEELFQDPLQALSEGLSSDHPDMGRYALSRLRRHGMSLERISSGKKRVWIVKDEPQRTQAKDLVIAALDNPHAKVRRFSQEILGEFYQKNSLEPIRHQLQAKRKDVRNRILLSLLHKVSKDEMEHKELIESLAIALVSPHENLRLDASSALAKKRPLTEKITQKTQSVLSELLLSHSEAVQRRSAQALAALEQIEAVKSLAERIEKDPASTAAFAPIVKAIEELAKGGKLAITEHKELRQIAEKSLLRELNSQGHIRRNHSYQALLSISGRPLLPDTPREERESQVHNHTLALRYLAAAARTNFDDIRLDAISRLHQLNDDNADLVLSELLSSPSDLVRSQALRSLVESCIKQGKHPTLLLEALSTPSALEGVNATKVAIAAILSAITTWAKQHSLPTPKEITYSKEERERIFETLAVAGLNAPNFKVRAEAMRGLGFLGDPRALQIVRLHLPDDARVYEQPLEQALENKRLSILRHVAADAISELLAKEGVSEQVKQEMFQRLLILLQDPDHKAKGAALFALGRHLDERILPFLEASLLSPKTRRLDPLSLRLHLADGESLEATLSHQELYALRAVAARAVAERNWNVEHIRERLALLLQDKDPSIRRSAAESFQQLVGKENEEFLLAAYESPYDDLKQPAIQGLIDTGKPSTAIRLLGERNEPNLLLRFLRREPTPLAEEASKLLQDQSTPFTQSTIAAKVLGALSIECAKEQTPTWYQTAETALATAIKRATTAWLDAARTVERPGIQEMERKEAKNTVFRAKQLFRSATRAFVSLLEAKKSSSSALALAASEWLLVEGPRGEAPARDIALQALKTSRVSPADASWPTVKKAIDLCLQSVDTNLRRLASNALACLAPKDSLRPQPGDAIAAEGLVSAYLNTDKASNEEILTRYQESDGVSAVIPAILKTQNAEALLHFLRETRGQGIRDPERDTDRSSKALHRRRLAAVNALGRPEFSFAKTVLTHLQEISKDRVEPMDLRKSARLAVRRLRRKSQIQSVV